MKSEKHSQKSLSSLFALIATLALSFALPLSALAATPDAGLTDADLVAGTDYVEIPGGQPFAATPGKIEVVEVFGYTCPHCASFEPHVSAWKADLPADVAYVAVPAPFGGYWIPYAQAFYAAREQQLVERTHAAVFRALHAEQSLPLMRATPTEIAAFYARHGADPEQFAATMTSAATEAKLQHARDFLQRSGVEGTPTLIVAGKYRVLGTTAQDILRNASALLARERASAD